MWKLFQYKHGKYYCFRKRYRLLKSKYVTYALCYETVSPAARGSTLPCITHTTCGQLRKEAQGRIKEQRNKDRRIGARVAPINFPPQCPAKLSISYRRIVGVVYVFTRELHTQRSAHRILREVGARTPQGTQNKTHSLMQL